MKTIRLPKTALGLTVAVCAAVLLTAVNAGAQDPFTDANGRYLVPTRNLTRAIMAGLPAEDTISVKVKLYDFHQDRTNPEFEQPFADGGARTNMVGRTLDRDKKPVMGSNPNMNHGVRFWFRDWNNLDSYLLSDSTITNSSHPSSSGKKYLEKFRPIYLYNNNRTQPPGYRIHIRNTNNTAIWFHNVGAEWHNNHNPTTGVNNTPYAYATATRSDTTIALNNSAGVTYTIDSAFVNRLDSAWLVFRRNSDGTFQFERQGDFFPLDGRGLERGRTADEIASMRFVSTGSTGSSVNHNFSYAMEMVVPFIYRREENQTFYFRGDDDVWVFINDRLALDLGGIKGARSDQFNLVDLAGRPEFGLHSGNGYDMRMFYSERHADLANILITTNLITTGPNEITLATDADTLVAGETVIGWGEISVDTGAGILRPGVCVGGQGLECVGGIMDTTRFPGTFTWKAFDVTPGGTPTDQRIAVVSAKGSRPTIAAIDAEATGSQDTLISNSADSILIYATRAYTQIRLVGEYRDDQGNYVIDSTLIHVVPGAPGMLTVENTFQRSVQNQWIPNHVPVDTIRLASNDTTLSNFYAIMRDKFGNWIGPASHGSITTASVGGTGNLTWTTGLPTIARAERGASLPNGEGRVVRVMQMVDTTTSLTASYATVGANFRDTTLTSNNVTVVLTAAHFTGIRIRVNVGQGAFRIVEPTDTIDIYVDADTLFDVQMQLSTDGSWVSSSAAWRPINLGTLTSIAGLMSQYTYTADASVMAQSSAVGMITVNVPGNVSLSAFATIRVNWRDPASMRLFARRGKPTVPDAAFTGAGENGAHYILRYPGQAHPDSVKPYAVPPGNAVTVMAGENVPLVSALFATAVPMGSSFLPNLQGTGMAGQVSWAIVEPVGAAGTTLTPTQNATDSAMFRSTVAYQTYRIRATFSNAGMAPVSQEIMIYVTPAAAHAVYIEPELPRSGTPAMNYPNEMEVVEFTAADTTQSIYAVVRDVFGNYVYPSGGYNPYDPTVALPNPATMWSSTPTPPVGDVTTLSDMFDKESGQCIVLRGANGEGVIIVTDSLLARTTVPPATGRYMARDTVPVRIVGFSYDSLIIVRRVVTGTDTSYVKIEGPLKITTNDDTTLFVVGKRDNPGDDPCRAKVTGAAAEECWDLVQVTWDRDEGLITSLTTPPSNTASWVISPTVTGAGKIIASRTGGSDCWMEDGAAVCTTIIIKTTLDVEVSPGPPTRMELLILTPPDQRIAGQEISFLVQYYNRRGLLTVWDPSWGAGQVVTIRDTLGTGYPNVNSNGAELFPKVVTYAGTNENRPDGGWITDLGYRPGSVGGKVGNGWVTALDDTIRTILYWASDQAHQITITQSTAGNPALTAVSDPFFIIPGPVKSVEIIVDGEPKDSIVINVTPGQKQMTTQGKDEFGNTVGTVNGQWCRTNEDGTIPPVTTTTPDSCRTNVPTIIYDVSRATENGTGRVCVAVAGTNGDCITVIVEGVTLKVATATTRDINGNGYLDRIDIRFQRATELLPGANLGSITILGGPSNDPFTVDRVVMDPDSKGLVAYLYLKENKTDDMQTGWLPSIIIGDGIFADVVKHPPLTAPTVLDGAPPVIKKALRWYNPDRITVEFSEDVRKPSGASGVPFTAATPDIMPNILFRIWDEPVSASASKKTARRRAVSKAGAVANADWPGWTGPALTELPGLLDTLTSKVLGVPGRSSEVEFALTVAGGRLLDLKPPRWINIMTFDRNATGSTAGIDRDSANVADVPVNYAQRENWPVQLGYGNMPNAKLEPVPNPARPDRTTPTGSNPGYNYKVITATHNGGALVHVRDGGGGAVFQVPIYIPPRTVDNKNMKIRCQIKVYDLVGNLVSSGRSDDVLGESTGSNSLLNQVKDGGNHAYMDLYWSGFNSKGMKAAPGTYRVIVYINYSGTSDPNAKGGKYQGMVGIGK